MPLIDLSDAVAELASGSYTVRRYTQAIVGGRAQRTETGTLTIVGSVQPATGRDVALLPQGYEVSEALTLFSSTELRTADGAAQLPDVVEVDGRRFTVQRVERWDALGGFFRAVLLMERQG